FGAKIDGNGDIKNYAEYLFENAGEAVMAWIIEGAKRVIDKDFHITPPECVRNAIDAYKQDNDWLEHFLCERCEIGDGYSEKSGELYASYRGFCLAVGEYTRSTADFYAAIEGAGFIRRRAKDGRYIDGLRLKPYNKTEASDEFDDFLK
ncbi:MAG: DNA primase, partial [Actinomycetes bacterium]|nr:DNA primase [Actinomycetes bacterium]